MWSCKINSSSCKTGTWNNKWPLVWEKTYKQKGISEFDRAVSAAAVTQTMAMAQNLLIIAIFVFGFDGCVAAAPGECYSTVCSYSFFFLKKENEMLLFFSGINLKRRRRTQTFGMLRVKRLFMNPSPWSTTYTVLKILSSSSEMVSYVHPQFRPILGNHQN